MHSIKLKTVGYWTATGLIAFAFGPGAIPDLIQAPPALAFVAPLGYPAYFLSILGAWKILGAIAILVPRFPRLKEWAYAGIFFDLTGAAISHAARGNGILNVIIPLVLVGVAFASWALRPEGRTLLATTAPSA
jgi:uncharacterized membrane protein YphA (DoxX/SURF4 family)